MAATFPSPRSSSTLHTTRRQPGAIPAYRPLEHFPFPHRQPATWVPCPLSSYGCFCPPDKVCKPCDSPGKIRMQRDPGVQHRCRHPFRKARLPLPRSRGQLSLPCSRHTHPFSFRIWKDGEEVCCILWKTVKRMCPGTFSRRGAVASATIYPCAECASSRSVFIV